MVRDGMRAVRIRQIALREDVKIDPRVHDVDVKENCKRWTRCGCFFPVNSYGIGGLRRTWRGVYVDLPTTCLECLRMS